MPPEGPLDRPDAEAPPLPRIIRDEGSAASTASKPQRVLVSHPDGREVPAIAKFAKDERGAPLAEYGERGAASEILASSLAELISAPVPKTEAVELPAELNLVTAAGKPAPGVAAASTFIDGAIDVNASDMVREAPKDDVARIAVFHAWIEAGDRGHNLIRSGRMVYSIDHATAFGSSWDATMPTGNFAPDGLLAPHLDADALRAAAAALSGVSDGDIDAAVDRLPVALVGSADVRTRLKENLRRSRDLVSKTISDAYPSDKGATS